jgi:hypothetical protein
MSTGLVKKLSAPLRIASTAMAISPDPVMTMMGVSGDVCRM